MQIDLQEPMELDAHFPDKKLSSPVTEMPIIIFVSDIQVGNIKKLQLKFTGKPREAIRPPWDGGWIWKKDEQGKSMDECCLPGIWCQCLVSLQRSPE